MANGAVKDKVNRWKTAIDHIKKRKTPVIWSHMPDVR